ncbi:hypothetical protein, partial [Escherichia coli]|uniref:hypothetical protein n=1 Tax=Escherichia coli TaxID=562 RepID=UPI002112A477
HRLHIKQGYPLWLHLATLDFAQRALQGAATPPLDPSNSTVSGCALSATGNRLGRTPDPHRCNTDGLRPPTNRVATSPVRLGLAGGAGRCPVVPVTTATRWRGASARLTS